MDILKSIEALQKAIIIDPLIYPDPTVNHQIK